jgi:uncharacterized lipoprotein NlpE involved in copper resistance
MNKFSFLLVLFAVIILGACNNNQNAVAEGDATETENMGSEEDAKAKAKSMQEPKSTTKKTQGQQRPSRATDFRIEDKSENIFSGEFAYMADAAYFINCSTNGRYSVLMQDAFPELEKTYLEVVGEKAGSRVYVVVEGAMQSKPAGEEGNFRGALKVSKVHSVNADKNCNSVIVKMGGMFTYFEGKADFKECKTGRVYSVTTDGAYKLVEQEYRQMMEEGKSVYAEIKGFRKAIPAEEGGSMKTGISITRFIGFDQSYACE